MKRKLWIALLAGVLWMTMTAPPPASGGDSGLLMDEPELRIILKEAEMQPEGMRVVLSCLNRGALKAGILFVTPKADGIDTVFASGWPSDEIVLPPGEEAEAELRFLPPEGADSMTRVSFRISFQGRLSTEMEIVRKLSGAADQDPDGYACSGGTLAGDETQILREEVTLRSQPPAAPFRIRDRITQAQAAGLDYGQAWICLREGETLIPFCSLRLRVDGEGNAEADWSGLALILAAAPDVPLETAESHDREELILETREMGLTGESVFYATLKLTVKGSAEEGYQIVRQELDSSELGGRFGRAPYGLMDQIELLLRVMEKNEAPAETMDVRSVMIPLTEPLEAMLLPAHELGEVWAYCEYFFQDDTDTVHPPFPCL